MAHLYKSLATWFQDSTWMRDRLVTHGAADGMGVYIKVLLIGVWIVSKPCHHWWLSSVGAHLWKSYGHHQG